MEIGWWQLSQVKAGMNKIILFFSTQGMVKKLTFFVPLFKTMVHVARILIFRGRSLLSMS